MSRSFLTKYRFTICNKTRKAVDGINRRQMYAVVPLYCVELPENTCRDVYRTLTISQSVFATRFTNWHFSLPNKSNLAFFKAFGNENYHSVLSGEKHGNCVPSVIKISKIGCMGHFSALKRQKVSRTKKTLGERAFRYKMERKRQAENTCSSVIRHRWLTFSYRNLGNFKGFNSPNGKSHKKSIRGRHTVGIPLIDGRFS